MLYDFMECPECGETMFLYDHGDGEKKWYCHSCLFEKYLDD